MVDPKLLDYVKKELAAGYKPEAIRSYLVNYGYDPASVEEAISAAAAAPAPKPAAPAAPAVKKKIPIIPVAGGILAVIFVVVVFLIFFAGKEEEAVVAVARALPLDLKLSMISSNVRQGDTILFDVILTSLDKKSRDIALIYEITDNSGVRIDQQEDLVSTAAKSFEQRQMDIPADAAPGRYTLTATARFDSEIVEETINFGVLAAGAAAAKVEVIEFAAELECPVSCDDNDVCTDDRCSAATNYQCVHFAVTPCCGNLKCEDFEDSNNCPTDCAPAAPTGAAVVVTLQEISQNARNYALTNLNQAENYCNSFSDTNQRDSCYYVVSQTSKQSKYCGTLASELKRDNCYSEYALAGDFTVCDKMTNPYTKQSCFELQAVSGTQQFR